MQHMQCNSHGCPPCLGAQPLPVACTEHSPPHGWPLPVQQGLLCEAGGQGPPVGKESGEDGRGRRRQLARGVARDGLPARQGNGGADQSRGIAGARQLPPSLARLCAECGADGVLQGARADESQLAWRVASGADVGAGARSDSTPATHASRQQRGRHCWCESREGLRQAGAGLCGRQTATDHRQAANPKRGTRSLHD
jgi:hypothetical protein